MRIARIRATAPVVSGARYIARKESYGESNPESLCVKRMAGMPKLCATGMARLRMMAHMMTSDVRDTRTLTLVLPESEWRALRAIEPDAVGWLQDRVRERLAHSAADVTESRSAGPAPARWIGHDDY